MCHILYKSLLQIWIVIGRILTNRIFPLSIYKHGVYKTNLPDFVQTWSVQDMGCCVIIHIRVRENGRLGKCTPGYFKYISVFHYAKKYGRNLKKYESQARYEADICDI